MLASIFLISVIVCLTAFLNSGDFSIFCRTICWACHFRSSIAISFAIFTSLCINSKGGLGEEQLHLLPALAINFSCPYRQCFYFLPALRAFIFIYRHYFFFSSFTYRGGSSFRPMLIIDSRSWRSSSFSILVFSSLIASYSCLWRFCMCRLT